MNWLRINFCIDDSYIILEESNMIYLYGGTKDFLIGM